jgi:hypothetical protein
MALALALGIFSGAAAAADDDPLFGVREGWSWPVIVIPPSDGWEGEAGESIKLAMRAAERELSLDREAIRGREVTFMFSSVASPDEFKTRLASWRGMRAAAIVTFADADFNAPLAAMCAEGGPSLIYADGEYAEISSRENGRPHPYLFALGLPYYARANALAEAASRERPGGYAAVFTDILSGKLARGAALTSGFLKARGMKPLDLSVTAYRQDQFAPQIREMESSGTSVYVCWLDAMATLSIWQSLERRGGGSVVYYSGPPQKILTDADGIILTDKDVLLERNEGGRHGIINTIRDAFDAVPKDPVSSAKAYALAKWVIGAYRTVGSGDAPKIAIALGEASGIPLMDETLSIDPNTHRPKSRMYGLLKVAGKNFESHGSVEVFSAETVE